MSEHFPALSAEEVLVAVAAKWDLSGPFPLPRGGWLACPVCRAPGPQPRWFQWHTRPGKPTVPRRCDVAFKCIDCSACWVHGVAVPRSYFEAHAYRQRRKIPWREARQVIEGA